MQNNLPIHLKDLFDKKINQAKSLQNNDTLDFLFYTDSHITNDSSFTDIFALNYINNQMDLSFTVCCGDNLDNAYSKEIHLDTAAKLVNTILTPKFFPVKGNHDDNSFIEEGISNIKYTMQPKEQYEIMFKRLEGTVNFDEENHSGLYYFYDIPEHKIRAIFLNSIDIPYVANESNPSAWKYAGQSTYAYSNAQLNWLSHTALDLPESEWNTILFTHINPFNEGMIGADNLACNSTVLLEILAAFMEGKTYNSAPTEGDFYQSVSVDFSKQGRGQVLAFFYGHTHSEQVLVKNGISYISTWNDCPRKSLSNPDAPNRLLGSTSECCLNVVSIDLQKRKLYMTKFGAGDDLVIDL
jgi:predicted phosphodiesterase